jgi:hypothetical protein
LVLVGLHAHKPNVIIRKGKANHSKQHQNMRQRMRKEKTTHIKKKTSALYKNRRNNKTSKAENNNPNNCNGSMSNKSYQQQQDADKQTHARHARALARGWATHATDRPGGS